MGADGDMLIFVVSIFEPKPYRKPDIAMLPGPISYGHTVSQLCSRGGTATLARCAFGISSLVPPSSLLHFLDLEVPIFPFLPRLDES